MSTSLVKWTPNLTPKQRNQHLRKTHTSVQIQAPTAEMFNMFCEISNPLHIKQMKKAEKTQINIHSKIFNPSPMLEEVTENQSKIDNNRKSKIIMQVIP